MLEVIFIVAVMAALILTSSLPAAAGDAAASGVTDIISNVLTGGNTLTIQQLTEVARNAGFSGPDLVTAVAIAKGESGGNPSKYNPETYFFTRHNIAMADGMGSYGLWQIFLHAHPEFSGQNLYDPQVNANAAYQVYVNAGQAFTPWSSFLNGSYAAFLSEAQQGVNT